MLHSFQELFNFMKMCAFYKKKVRFFLFKKIPILMKKKTMYISLTHKISNPFINFYKKKVGLIKYPISLSAFIKKKVGRIETPDWSSAITHFGQNSWGTFYQILKYRQYFSFFVIRGPCQEWRSQQHQYRLHKVVGSEPRYGEIISRHRLRVSADLNSS